MTHELAVPTSRQMAALRAAKGGATTYEGTPEHQLFEEMAELGFVKEATLVAGGVAWRLSGNGLAFAYADDRR